MNRTEPSIAESNKQMSCFFSLNYCKCYHRNAKNTQTIQSTLISRPGRYARTGKKINE